MIDEQILPEKFYNASAGRSFISDACVYISFYYQTAGRLTSEERRKTIAIASGRGSGERGRRIVRDDLITINLQPFWSEVEKRLRRLQAAREAVAIDPEILEGAAVVRGTRVGVYDLAASVAAGHPMERILAAYPGVRPEQVELACLFAEANPQRGRPREDNHARAVLVRSTKRIRTNS